MQQGEHSPDNVKFPDISDGSQHSSTALGMLSVTHIMPVLVSLSIVECNSAWPETIYWIFNTEQTPSKYMYGSKYEAYYATFPWQYFFPTFPWLLEKSMTFPWQLSNSLDISRFSTQVVSLMQSPDGSPEVQASSKALSVQEFTTRSAMQTCCCGLKFRCHGGFWSHLT